VNWQAVLWHEFCHVVTLQMTRNKMPRWLSEGISVYEELQANPSWGQRMNPQYREMIKGGDLTPVSKLSAAFLAPRTPMHLQFAYYESSLVVEFIVQKFGLNSLKAILSDLGSGTDINQAIEAHTMPLADLEKDFSSFATERAEKLAPGLDWEKPKLEDLVGLRASSPQVSTSSEEPRTKSKAGEDTKETSSTKSSAPGESVSFGQEQGELANWVAKHPTNYYGLMEQAKTLLGQKEFEKAKAPLKKLIDSYPAQTGPESAYAMLASAHRALGETNAERQVLAKFAQQDDEAKEAYLRLAELGAAAGDWPEVIENVQRCLAVDPIIAAPYRWLARASGSTGNALQSIQANRALLQLDPPNPAEVHYELAQALHRTGDPGAQRQVLEALEEAPRYRAALKLLLEIHHDATPAKSEEPHQTDATP
jgi:tetratricopeptide (TPR) repeat protein